MCSLPELEEFASFFLSVVVEQMILEHLRTARSVENQLLSAA